MNKKRIMAITNMIYVHELMIAKTFINDSVKYICYSGIIKKCGLRKSELMP